MNTLANRPFPLKQLGFGGYSTFLDGLITPNEVLSGPYRAETEIFSCDTLYALNPDAVKFQGGFDVSPAWGTDNTEGVRLRIWSSIRKSGNSYRVERMTLELIWSWMDTEPHELCFLKTEMKAQNLAFPSASYSILLLTRAQKLWPKEIFNTERYFDLRSRH